MNYQIARWMLSHWLTSSIPSFWCVIDVNYIEMFCNLYICPARTNKVQNYSMYNINQLVIVDLANFKCFPRHHILYRSMYDLHSRIPLFGKDLLQSTASLSFKAEYNMISHLAFNVKGEFEVTCPQMCNRLFN